MAGSHCPAAAAGLVRHVGYVDPARRRELYVGARLLVQPSFEEGFGFPVLEAMTVGVPVVAASRGALPEVLGDAGLLVDPDDPDEMAAAIARLIDDDGLAAASASKGLRAPATSTGAHGARRLRRLSARHPTPPMRIGIDAREICGQPPAPAAI